MHIDLYHCVGTLGCHCMILDLPNIHFKNLHHVIFRCSTMLIEIILRLRLF
jgi:hypothetical protein